MLLVEMGDLHLNQQFLYLKLVLPLLTHHHLRTIQTLPFLSEHSISSHSLQTTPFQSTSSACPLTIQAYSDGWGGFATKRHSIFHRYSLPSSRTCASSISADLVLRVEGIPMDASICWWMVRCPLFPNDRLVSWSSFDFSWIPIARIAYAIVYSSAMPRHLGETR